MSDFLAEKKLLPENTRVRKTSSGDFEILIASSQHNPANEARDLPESHYDLPAPLNGRKATLVYGDYSGPMEVIASNLDQAVNRKTPILAALQGEIRSGEQYAYWLEIAARPDGFAYTGKLTVFLQADLPKLEAELRQR